MTKQYSEELATAEPQDGLVRFLYEKPVGRVVRKVVTRPGVSRAVGAFLDTRLSKPLIRRFVDAYHVDLDQFEDAPFRTFNDFFCRKVKDGRRPIDEACNSMVSPCDGGLLALPISATGTFLVKGARYTVFQLLRNEELAQFYEGGTAFIFRLGVSDYHRYCFPADGQAGPTTRIPGVLHTVSPIAQEHVQVYKENAREYSLLETDQFGDLLLMEVGALLVGRIVNGNVWGPVLKGQEKGFFQYGGSTIIVLAPKDATLVRADIAAASAKGIETLVQYGEAVAISALS